MLWRWRYLNRDNPRDDYHLLRRLADRVGLVGLERYWERRIQQRWERKNPYTYRLYEQEGQIVGCFNLVPVYESSYLGFTVGNRNLFEEDSPDDMLSAAEFEEQQHTGIWFYPEFFHCAKPELIETMRAHLYFALTRVRLMGVVTGTLRGDNEQLCERAGFKRLRPCGATANGARWVWYCDREIARNLGPDHPMFHAFLDLEDKYSPPQLGLTPAEKRVAYLYHVRILSREEVAKQLFLSETTVEDHIKSIHQKARERRGWAEDRSTRIRLVAYLRDHPAEYLESA